MAWPGSVADFTPTLLQPPVEHGHIVSRELAAVLGGVPFPVQDLRNLLEGALSG
jgi:hypothetical protein